MPFAAAVLNRVRSEILTRRDRARGVELGRDVRYAGVPIVSMTPGSTIAIGDRVRLISSPKLATLGVNHAVVLRTLAADAAIVLGNDVGISGGAICAARSVTIGDGTMLGANVTIADTDFHPLLHADRRYAPRPEASDRDAVRVGRNVFIGTGAIILKGVTIGDNVVVGAGAVVSRDIPANSVAAGNPAAVIRSLAIA